MLDAHPLIAIPPETGFAFMLGTLRDDPDAARSHFVETVTTSSTFDDSSLDPSAFTEAIEMLEPFTYSEGMRTFYRMYSARFSKARWGDKTPEYALHVERIADLLPEAAFVHLIRDGRDVALSIRPLWFSPGDDIATLATDWRRRVEAARESGRTQKKYLEVRYEDLVAEPEKQLRLICEFISVDWNDQMLEYHLRAEERLGEVKTRHNEDGTVLISREGRLTNHKLTSRPPTDLHVGRWRSEMTESEQLEFWTIAGDLLEELGYSAT